MAKSIKLKTKMEMKMSSVSIRSPPLPPFATSIVINMNLIYEFTPSGMRIKVCSIQILEKD